MSERHPKRLVFCFDGTWNQLSVDEPTNVARLAQMVLPTARDGTRQIVYYDEGIGTHTNRISRKLEGAFGWGMLKIIHEAYRFLIFNYEPGDRIYAFGFSRGAFTARSFLGFIRHAGILDVISANKIEKAIEIYRKAPAGQTGEESGQALRFRSKFCRGVCVSEEDREFRRRVDPDFDPEKVPLLDIRYLGVWDTVSALGVPAFVPGARRINRKYMFHDAVLTSKIKAARHAVAIDEKRPTFRATLFGEDKVAELNAMAEAEAGTAFEPWQRPYLEQWFPGVHGAVGGGGSRRGLSDAALFWVLTGATRAGLKLRGEQDARTFLIDPDPFDHLENVATRTLWERGALGRLRRLARSSRKGPSSPDAVALVTYRRWFADREDLPDKADYRPATLAAISAAIGEWPYSRPPEYKSALAEHVVARGDTLSGIARERLGDSRRYPEIFDLNRDRIDDPDHLCIGQRLRLPVTDGPEPSAGESAG